MLGDLRAGGKPDVRKRFDILQGEVGVFGALGLSDHRGVNGDAHDPPTFGIEPVELPPHDFKICIYRRYLPD